MPSINITISNLPQIRAAFREAPALMVAELNAAIKRTVLRIQSQSMINTPVRTGRLRASTSTLFGNLRGEVGAHVFYDIFVHDGTRFMRARPYLLDAVHSTNRATEQEFGDAVQRVLDNIGEAT